MSDSHRRLSSVRDRCWSFGFRKPERSCRDRCGIRMICGVSAFQARLADRRAHFEITDTGLDSRREWLRGAKDHDASQIWRGNRVSEIPGQNEAAAGASRAMITAPRDTGRV